MGVGESKVELCSRRWGGIGEPHPIAQSFGLETDLAEIRASVRIRWLAAFQCRLGLSMSSRSPPRFMRLFVCRVVASGRHLGFRNVVVEINKCGFQVLRQPEELVFVCVLLHGKQCLGYPSVVFGGHTVTLQICFIICSMGSAFFWPDTWQRGPKNAANVAGICHWRQSRLAGTDSFEMRFGRRCHP